MLSIETEARIARILLALAESEKAIEINRQLLSGNNGFDPYSLFTAIDIEGKNRINATNIAQFLKCKGIYCSQIESQFLILFYDEDNDGSLSYYEFINLVQSSLSKNKTSNSSLQHNSIPITVEHSFTKLLEKEIELARRMLSLLTDLKMRIDFNVHDIFHAMKSWNCITVESLRKFFERNSVVCDISDINAIIKRLDLNRNGNVDICELHAFLGFPRCKRCCPCRLECHCVCCSCCCVVSCVNMSCKVKENKKHMSSVNDIIKDNNNMLYLKGKTNINNGNAYDNKAPINKTDNPVKITQLSKHLSLRLSPERKYSPRNKASQTQSLHDNNIHSSNTDFHTQRFINYLKQIMLAESRLELTKINLALRSDFNVEDTFRIFELNGRGYLTEEDLQFGLNSFNIQSSSFEIQCLLKHYDLLNKGSLNYADFFDMLVPYEKTYRAMVEHRPPLSCCTSRSSGVFLHTTHLILKQLFTLLIEYESKFNAVKSDFIGVRSKLRQLYKEIDVSGKGKVSEDDITNYLQKVGIFTSIKDCNLLFIRLDRNRDGVIDYSEFEREFTSILH